MKRAVLARVPFVNDGVGCVAFVTTPIRPAAVTQPLATAQEADANKYSRLLPHPTMQHELMRRLRAAEHAMYNDPENPYLAAAAEKIRIELFERFHRYLTNAANSAAASKELSFMADEARDEFRSLGTQVFMEVLRRYRPGRHEVSRLLSREIKWRFLHLKQRLAARATSLGAAQVGDRVLGDAIALKAAERAGTVDDLVASRKWKPSKLKSVEMARQLLDGATRLDQQLTEEGGEVHELIDSSAALTVQKDIGAEARDVMGVLNHAIGNILGPLERLTVLSYFTGLRCAEQHVQVEHATSGDLLTFDRSTIPSFARLSAVIGRRHAEVTQVLRESLSSLKDHLHAHGLGVDEIGAFAGE